MMQMPRCHIITLPDAAAAFSLFSFLYFEDDARYWRQREKASPEKSRQLSSLLTTDKDIYIDNTALAVRA